MSSLLTKLKYSFGRSSAVPAGGTLQLFAVGQTLQGFRVIRASLITGASLRVSAGDAARTYDLDVRVNAVSVATLPLPLSTLSVSTILFAVPVVVGDIVTAFMVRTAGAGASTFGDEEALVEITER